jgi:predicted Zn-dependent protease
MKHTLIVIFLCFIAHSAWAQTEPAAKKLDRAAALIIENKLDLAEQQLKSILAGAPNTAVALDLLGTVRAKQGRLDEAEQLFTRAVRADNQLTGAHMNLAYLYLLKGKPEKTTLELKEVLRLDPNNADARYKLAWVLFTQSRLDECISFVENEKQSRPVSASMLELLADAYLKKGNVEEAEKSYLAVIAEQSTNADALIGMANVSKAKGNRSVALDYLSRSKVVLSNAPDHLYKYAVAAFNLNQVEEAVWALKKAIALRPDEASFYLILGMVQLGFKKPDLQDAEESFRESLKRQPDNAQAQLHLGYVLLKQKKYADAQVWLEKSVQKQSRSPEGFYYLGLIAQEQNENERAIELFQKSIELEPRFANAHIALGAVYLKLKDYPRAQKELETGVKINPDSSKGHYNLAVLYARLKDPKRAQEEMRIIERLKSEGKTPENESDMLAPSGPR